MQEFVDYVNHGWKLCRIQRGLKGPRSKGWNELSNAITRPDMAMHLESAGLCHAYSGTAALDVDRYDEAKAWLAEKSIDLDALMAAPDAVQISSGTSNRGKLIYALKEPLPSKSLADGAFELRCGTTAGRTAQDVLPPSKHPSGRTYEWRGDWKRLPVLPDVLHKLWSDELQRSGPTDASTDSTEDLDSLRAMVIQKDPNCGYEEWVKIGMAIHHETGGSGKGLELWDKWSFPGRSYPGAQALSDKWASFGNSSTPVTAAVLRKGDIAIADEFDDITAAPLDAFAEALNETKLEASAPTRFTFVSLGQLFLRPKPDWIIQGVLPHAEIGAVWGQPGGGKTFLSIDLALVVALGHTWRGLFVEQGSVDYIAAEDDAGVQVRFAAGLAIRGAADAPIQVLPASPSFLKADQAKGLMVGIKATGRPKIVFVDTLAAVTPGSDENTGKDMGMLIDYCKQIHKAVGALVLVVHHEGKTTGKGPRGWSGLHGAFDVEWAVTAEGDAREMTISKMKNAETGKVYSFKLAPVGDSCVVEWV